MRWVRLIVNVLVLAVLAAAVLAAFAMVPVVQTWIVDAKLGGWSGGQATLDSVSAGFGSVDVTNLEIKSGGADFVAPEIRVRMPLLEALVRRQVKLRALVAKGWKLDLSQVGAGAAAGHWTAGGWVPASPEPGPAKTAGPKAPAGAAAVAAVEDVLGGWAASWVGQVDGVDLEGEVLLPAQPGREATHLNVTIRGGGLAPGREGTFPVVVSTVVVQSDLSQATVSAKGEIRARMGAAGRVKLTGFDGTWRLQGGSYGAGVTFGARFAAAAGADGRETLRAALARDGRPVFQVSAALPIGATAGLGAGGGGEPGAGPGAGGLSGRWQCEVRSADVAALLPGWTGPEFAVTGSGSFDTQAADWRQVHAVGRLAGAVRGIGAWVPALSAVPAVTGAAEFDAALAGSVVRVKRLQVDWGRPDGGQPVATGETLAPFSWDTAAGTVLWASPAPRPARAAPKPGAPRTGQAAAAADIARLSFRQLPLASILSAGPDGARIVPLFGGVGVDAAQGFVSAAVIVGTDGGKYLARSDGAAVADGIGVVRDGRVLARGITLTGNVTGGYSPGDGSWDVGLNPIRVRQSAGSAGGAGRGGQVGPMYGEVRGTVSCPGSGQPVAVAVKGSADLQAVEATGIVPLLGRVGGRTVSGEVSATLGSPEDGSPTTVDVSFDAGGRDAKRTVKGSMHTEEDSPGNASFTGSVGVRFGAEATEVSVDGRVVSDAGGSNVYLRLNGDAAHWDQLRFLAAPFARIVGAQLGVPGVSEVGAARGGLPGSASPATGGESAGSNAAAAPFWGDWSGRVAVDFATFYVGERKFGRVAGVFQVDPTSLQLKEGVVGLGGKRMAKVQGTLNFDAGGAPAYRVAADETLEAVEGTALVPAPSGQDPVIEGHFKVAADIVGSGASLADLITNTRQRFRITSDSGIVRALATDVAEAIPQAKTTVGERLGSVGSTIGTFFGVQRKQIVGANPITPTAQAVLDFTNDVSEIGCDQIAIDAAEGIDGAIELTRILIVAPDERITGTGRIAAAKGKALGERPVSMDLTLWARRAAGRALGKAGLLTTRKDAQGYALMKGAPIHLVGTLNRLQAPAWHAMLVHAALAAPVGSGRGKK